MHLILGLPEQNKKYDQHVSFSFQVSAGLSVVWFSATAFSVAPLFGWNRFVSEVGKRHLRNKVDKYLVVETRLGAVFVRHF